MEEYFGTVIFRAGNIKAPELDKNSLVCYNPRIADQNLEIEGHAIHH